MFETRLWTFSHHRNTYSLEMFSSLQLQQPGCRRCMVGRVNQKLPVVCRYRGSSERDDHREEQWLVYTSADAVDGGLAPESHAVLLCLLEKHVQFKEIKVDVCRKSQDFAELYHSIIPDKDVRERVPVLVHGPRRLVDHSTIVEYLATAYPDSGTPLTPPDPYAAARVKLFTQYFMDHVVPAYKQLVHTSAIHVDEAKQTLMKALAAVDEFLALHGTGGGDYAVGPHYGWSMTSLEQAGGIADTPDHEHYLMGPFYTTAEVLCTPYVARMVQTLPDWRNFDILAECEARQLHRVTGWMRACLARPAAQLTSPGRKELVEGLVEWEWSHAV